VPLFYDEVFIDESYEIMTISEFSPPVKGRTVKFCLENGYTQKVVYTCIDGQYAGPFTKAGPLDTAVHGLERLRAGCHSAEAIVIDMSQTELPQVQLNMSPVIVTLSSGEKAVVRINGTLQASIRVKDSDALIDDLRYNGVDYPEDRAVKILEGCFKTEIRKQLMDKINAGNVMNGLGRLDEMAEQIRNSAIASTEQQMPYQWLEIVSCSLSLTVPNMDEIITKENYLWREREETLKMAREARMRMIEKTHDALLGAYRREPVPKEMMQLVVSYVQNNPMVSADELLRICNELKKMSQTYSPEMIVKTAESLGYMLENKNTGKGRQSLCVHI